MVGGDKTTKKLTKKNKQNTKNTTEKTNNHKPTQKLKTINNNNKCKPKK